MVAARALLLAAALLGGALALLRAWEADPCIVDSIDGPRPCTFYGDTP